MTPVTLTLGDITVAEITSEGEIRLRTDDQSLIVAAAAVAMDKNAELVATIDKVRGCSAALLLLAGALISRIKTGGPPGAKVDEPDVDVKTNMHAAKA